LSLRLAKAEKLIDIVAQYEHGFCKSYSQRKDCASLRVGVSPDCTLAYIDFLFDDLLFDPMYAPLIKIGQPKLPAAFKVAGLGTYFSPYFVDTNDMLLQAVAHTDVASTFIDEAFIDFIVELNTRLRIINRTSLRIGLYRLIKYLANEQSTRSLGGLTVQICLFENLQATINNYSYNYKSDSAAQYTDYPATDGSSRQTSKDVLASGNQSNVTSVDYPPPEFGNYDDGDVDSFRYVHDVRHGDPSDEEENSFRIMHTESQLFVAPGTSPSNTSNNAAVARANNNISNKSTNPNQTTDNRRMMGYDDLVEEDQATRSIKLSLFGDVDSFRAHSFDRGIVGDLRRILASGTTHGDPHGHAAHAEPRARETSVSDARTTNNPSVSEVFSPDSGKERSDTASRDRIKSNESTMTGIGKRSSTFFGLAPGNLLSFFSARSHRQNRTNSKNDATDSDRANNADTNASSPSGADTNSTSATPSRVQSKADKRKPISQLRFTEAVSEVLAGRLSLGVMVSHPKMINHDNRIEDEDFESDNEDMEDLKYTSGYVGSFTAPEDNIGNANTIVVGGSGGSALDLWAQTNSGGGGCEHLFNIAYACETVHNDKAGYSSDNDATDDYGKSGLSKASGRSKKKDKSPSVTNRKGMGASPYGAKAAEMDKFYRIMKAADMNTNMAGTPKTNTSMPPASDAASPSLQPTISPSSAKKYEATEGSATDDELDEDDGGRVERDVSNESFGYMSSPVGRIQSLERYSEAYANRSDISDMDNPTFFTSLSSSSSAVRPATEATTNQQMQTSTARANSARHVNNVVNNPLRRRSTKVVDTASSSFNSADNNNHTGVTGNATGNVAGDAAQDEPAPQSTGYFAFSIGRSVSTENSGGSAGNNSTVKNPLQRLQHQWKHAARNDAVTTDMDALGRESNMVGALVAVSPHGNARASTSGNVGVTASQTMEVLRRPVTVNPRTKYLQTLRSIRRADTLQRYAGVDLAPSCHQHEVTSWKMLRNGHIVCGSFPNEHWGSEDFTNEHTADGSGNTTRTISNADEEAGRLSVVVLCGHTMAAIMSGTEGPSRSTQGPPSRRRRKKNYFLSLWDSFVLSVFARIFLGGNVYPRGAPRLRKILGLLIVLLCIVDFGILIDIATQYFCIWDAACNSMSSHAGIFAMFLIWPGAVVLSPLTGLISILLGPSGRLARIHASWSRLAVINDAIIFAIFLYKKHNAPNYFGYIIGVLLGSRAVQIFAVDFYIAHIDQIRWTRGWDGLVTSLYADNDKKTAIRSD
jgi:hypothetical protein